MHEQPSPAKRVQKQPVIERGRPVPHVYFSIKADGKKVYLVRKPLDPQTGRRDFVTVGTSLADARELATEAHRKDGPQTVTGTTLADVYENWCSTRTDLAPRTREHVEGHYRLHIAPTFGRVKVREINPTSMQRWVNNLKATSGAPLADGTRAVTLASLDRLLKHARDMQVLGVVPTLPTNRKPPKSPGRTRVLAADEEHRLMDAAADWLKPMIAVALAQALRIGEVCGLRWQDVDFDGNRLHVRGALGRDGSFGPTKGKKECTIPLLPEARTALLQAHLAAGRPGDGYVFVTGLGTPRGIKQVSVSYVKAVKAAGLADTEVCFHTLRHTAVTRAGARPNMTLAILAEYARHSNKQITERYLHVHDSNAMDAIFGLAAVSG